MFNIEEHVTLPHLPVTQVGTEANVPTYDCTKEVLVKICLNADEGVTPADGRYRTFYNMYFINKLWASKEANMQSMTKVFNSFVVAEYNAAYGAIFEESAYGREVTTWINDNLSDYYFVFPIITIKKGVYKFNGVNLPQTHTAREGFFFAQRYLKLKALYIGGVWRSTRLETTGNLMNHLANGNTHKRLLKDQEDAIAEWVHIEIDRLAECMA